MPVYKRLLGQWIGSIFGCRAGFEDFIDIHRMYSSEIGGRKNASFPTERFHKSKIKIAVLAQIKVIPTNCHVLTTVQLAPLCAGEKVTK